MTWEIRALAVALFLMPYTFALRRLISGRPLAQRKSKAGWVAMAGGVWRLVLEIDL